MLFSCIFAVQSGRGSQRKLSPFLVQKWIKSGRAKAVLNRLVTLGTQLDSQALVLQCLQEVWWGLLQDGQSPGISILNLPGPREAVRTLQRACSGMGCL